jgi:hypothetical protein
VKEFRRKLVNKMFGLLIEVSFHGQSLANNQDDSEVDTDALALALATLGGAGEATTDGMLIVFCCLH